MPLRLPPRAHLDEVLDLLQQAGLPVAVGGSALLASLGLIERVRDWDVTVDAETAQVLALLSATGLPVTDQTTRHPPYATRARLVLDAGDHEIDVLVGFTVDDGSTITTVPAQPVAYWRGLPMADPASWAAAYRVLGRSDRSTALEHWLATSPTR